jgi:hypothetical protein
MNTEQHPLISDPPSTVHIQSENADALVKMYYVLEGEARRRDFDVFLLSRMNRDSDYRTVAYLVVLVMKELNRLPVFLVHAKEQLAGGTGFGFNNVVRMLGSMLRASWDRFSDDELDACERFVSDLEGDSCYVRDKVAAVRAARARQSPPAAQPPAAPPLPRA